MMMNSATRVKTTVTNRLGVDNLQVVSEVGVATKNINSSSSSSSPSSSWSSSLSPSPPPPTPKLIREILLDARLKKESQFTTVKTKPILIANGQLIQDVEMKDNYVEKPGDNGKSISQLKKSTNGVASQKLTTVLIDSGNNLQLQIKPELKQPILLNGNSLNFTALKRHKQQQQSDNGQTIKPLEINSNHSEQTSSLVNSNQNVYLITTPIDLLATSAQVLQHQQQQQQQPQQQQQQIHHHHHIINHLKTPTTVITAPVAPTTSVITKSSPSTTTALYSPAAGSTITISTNGIPNGGLLTSGTTGVTTVTLSSPISPSSSSMNSSPPLSSSSSQKGVRDEKRRANHNEVERRRRDNINKWIGELSKVIPDCNGEQFKLASKSIKENKSKGGILEKTVQFVTEVQMQNQFLMDKLETLESLQTENETLKKLNENYRRENEILKQKLALLSNSDKNSNVTIDESMT